MSSSSDHAGEDSDKKVGDVGVVAGLPGAVVVPEDPAAPSAEVSSKRQRLSDVFTIVCEFEC